MTEPPHPAAAMVRPARPGDATAVGVVQVASWRQGYAGLLPENLLAGLKPEALADVWRQAVEHPPSARHRLVVACAGAQVVGFAAVGPCVDPDAEERIAELLILAVHPDRRGTGHGRRLLHSAIETVAGWEATAVVAWVPRDDERTRGFLQAAGFVPDSAWRDRGIDEDGRTLREVRLVASVNAMLAEASKASADTARAQP